jgi:hypothetical protein
MILARSTEEHLHAVVLLSVEEVAVLVERLAAQSSILAWLLHQRQSHLVHIDLAVRRITSICWLILLLSCEQLIK